MRRPSRAGLSLVLAFCAGIPLAAQNLESVGKEKPFPFAGGLSSSKIFDSFLGIASRRVLDRYVAFGQLNPSRFGWTARLTFTLSNKKSFSQPFNQYSLYPTSKWITAHAGLYIEIVFPSLSIGHIFLGAIGVALDHPRLQPLGLDGPSYPPGGGQEGKCEQPTTKSQ